MDKNKIALFKNKMMTKGKVQRDATALLHEMIFTYMQDPDNFEEHKAGLKERMDALSSEAREKWLTEHFPKIDGLKGYDRILRWDYEETLLATLSPENQGKSITDNNPLFNCSSVNELDQICEAEPFPKYPGTQGTPGINIFWGMPSLEQSGVDMFKYQLQIGSDALKMAMDQIAPAPVSEERVEDLNKLKTEIIEKSKELGFGFMGVTKVDRRFLSMGDDSYAPYQNIIILGIEMNKDDIDQAPNYEDCNPTFKAYMDSGREVHILAEFIRSKGYGAHPRISLDGSIKFVPHAVNAGVVNFGTSSNAISKEFGTRFRLCGIVTEAELPLDRPRDLNVEEFCSRCRMCQKTCPVQSIPKEAIRHRGTNRRKVRDGLCFSSMVGSRRTCAICIKICPMSKFGFDKCMESLPQYYQFNLMD